MTATYTFDVFTTLDGYGSYGPDGDWGGYWGKQGPEFLDRRLALYGEEQRMVLGANTFRQFVQLLGPNSGALQEIDPVNAQLRSLPGLRSTDKQTQATADRARIGRDPRPTNVPMPPVDERPGQRAGLSEVPHGLSMRFVEVCRLAVELLHLR